MTNTLKDTPMIIPKISPSVDYNWWFKCLGTQLNESINQNTLKVPKSPKLLSQRISKVNVFIKQHRSFELIVLLYQPRILGKAIPNNNKKQIVNCMTFD